MRTQIIIIILMAAALLSGCLTEGIEGRYVYDNNSYIKLNSDGTFQQKGIKYHSVFAVEGLYTVEKSGNITLHYPYGFFAEFSRNETGLVENTGAMYEKQK